MTDVREGSELKAVIPIVKARQIGLIISSLSLLNSMSLPVKSNIGNIAKLFCQNTGEIYHDDQTPEEFELQH